MNKVTTASIQKMKIAHQKIAMLTAYDYPTAKILDESEVDIVLVGDSLGMVILGYEDTTKVTMEDMLHHTKAVSRGVKNAMVVADMPFLSYHIGTYQSVINAGRLVQEGNATAVKLEGGIEVLEDIKAIIKAGIPVMGHIGLTPQSILKFGSYAVQGKTFEQAQKLIDDALALEEAGVFSIVLECIPAELAKIITEKLSIPTIGIGAGIDCDGQVLVLHDMIGLYQDKSPSFVKRYTQINDIIHSAVSEYSKEVKASIFPDKSRSFTINSEIIDKLYGGK